jgi:hypothetical protein
LDSWLEGVPLCQQYPVLYELAEKQKCSVAEVKRDGWVIHFKSWGLVRGQWYELACKLNNVQLNEEKDEVYWK